MSFHFYLSNKISDSKRWAVGIGPHYEAKALYDFNSMSDGEVPFKRGDRLRIAPKGWWNGFVQMSGSIN